jgi:hypothetical protein
MVAAVGSVCDMAGSQLFSIVSISGRFILISQEARGGYLLSVLYPFHDTVYMEDPRHHSLLTDPAGNYPGACNLQHLTSPVIMFLHPFVIVFFTFQCVDQWEAPHHNFMKFFSVVAITFRNGAGRFSLCTFSIAIHSSSMPLTEGAHVAFFNYSLFLPGAEN